MRDCRERKRGRERERERQKERKREKERERRNNNKTEIKEKNDDEHEETHTHTENNKKLTVEKIMQSCDCLKSKSSSFICVKIAFYNRESVSYGKRYDLNNCTAFVMLHEPSALD